MKKFLFFIFAAGLALVSCDSDNDDNSNNSGNPISLTRSEEEMAVKHVDFAFNFFKAVEKHLAGAGETTSRMAVSPLSASFAASMMANGTAGETQREVLDVLGFTDYPIDELNAYNQKLVNKLVSIDKKSEVKIANSFWVNEKVLEPLPTFTQTLEENYDAEVKCVGFATALPDINNWCSEKTSGMIPKILNQLSEFDSFVLLNALYFKGEWSQKFNKEDNNESVFTDSQGNQLEEATYMNGTFILPYMQTDRFALASFPFGNKAFSMTVLLPDLGVSLEECLNELDGERWSECVETMNVGSERLVVKLPKFKIDFKTDLKEVLPDMGMNLLFSAEADFSPLTNVKTWDRLESCQACAVEVDEEGATAAAVTSISGMNSIGGLEIPFQVTRPFLFFITEQSTGTILFMGRVSEVK